MSREAKATLPMVKLFHSIDVFTRVSTTKLKSLVELEHEGTQPAIGVRWKTRYQFASPFTRQILLLLLLFPAKLVQ